MMTNIFSIFDPSSSCWILNWISSFLVFFLFPSLFWILPNKFYSIWSLLMNSLYTEFKLLLGTSNFLGSTQMFIGIFVFIMISNVSGLFPYIFTSTSHMAMTLSFSLPIWMSLMFYGWFYHPIYMLAHLIPQNTPYFLMSFMVLIETVSNIIRPMTLAIRLTANMVAGHLLMTLLGNQIAFNEISMIKPLMILLPIILLLLEIAVAFIQSYVFSILVVLYANEISYDN